MCLRITQTWVLQDLLAQPCMLTSQTKFLLPCSNLVEGRIKAVKEQTIGHIYKHWGLPLDIHYSTTCTPRTLFCNVP